MAREWGRGDPPIVQANNKRSARQCEPRRLFAPRKALCCARRRIPVAPAGPDAPTPAREWDLPSHGALTLFFRWRKKSVQKKASGTATPEAARPAARRGLRSAVAPSGLSSTSVRFAHPPGKSPLLPIFERGSSQCRARRSWIAISYDRARSCSLFSSFKKGKAFSLRCLSPLCSAAAGTGQTQMALLGMSRCGLRGFAAQKNGLDFFFAAGTIHTQITSLGMRRYKLNIFVTQKASMDSYPRWPF